MKALALIDERCSAAVERALAVCGFRVVRVQKSARLPEDVAAHPDVLMFYDAAAGVLISSCEYCERVPWVFGDIRAFSGVKMQFSDELFGDAYPRDCIFNAVRYGGTLVCKADTVSKKVLEYALKAGLRIVNTKQGYPACTALRLSDGVAVTADCGMANTLEKIGVKVFKIRQGYVSLPGREYGFIGGTCGVFDGVAYFLGRVENHPDFEIISSALKAAGLSYVSLSDEPLFDGGQILFFRNTL